MKLLAKLQSRAELEGVKALLESNGIPVFIGNEASIQYTAMLNSYEIWVVVEEQFGDALKLLADKNHEVENPVDLGDFKEEAELQAKSQFTKMVDSFMNIVVGIFFILFVIYFLHRLEVF